MCRASFSRMICMPLSCCGPLPIQLPLKRLALPTGPGTPSLISIPSPLVPDTPRVSIAQFRSSRARFAHISATSPHNRLIFGDLSSRHSIGLPALRAIDYRHRLAYTLDIFVFSTPNSSKLAFYCLQLLPCHQSQIAGARPTCPMRLPGDKPYRSALPHQAIHIAVRQLDTTMRYETRAWVVGP